MPRIKPLPEHELGICTRLAKFRNARGLTRAEFARGIGVNRFSLASIEAGKAPVRFGVAWACKEKYQLSLVWLAESEGNMLGNYAISYPETASPKMLFSNAYKLFVGRSLTYAMEQLHAFPADEIWAATRSKGSELSITEIEDLFARVSRYVQPKHHGQFKRDMAAWAADVASNLRKERLTKTATADNHAAMPDLWPALKKQLQAKTAKTGKSALAEFLDVDLTRVSQWLTDAKSQREPGAEYALQMQDWLRRKT